jgi:hypothetical protein
MHDTTLGCDRICASLVSRQSAAAQGARAPVAAAAATRGCDPYAIVGARSLAAAPVQYMNGRDDDWFNTPPETRHL